MKYKIIMLSYLRQEEDIVLEKGLTKKEANERLKYYKKLDWVHYYEIKEDK